MGCYKTPTSLVTYYSTSNSSVKNPQLLQPQTMINPEAPTRSCFTNWSPLIFVFCFVMAFSGVLSFVDLNPCKALNTNLAGGVQVGGGVAGMAGTMWYTKREHNAIKAFEKAAAADQSANAEEKQETAAPEDNDPIPANPTTEPTGSRKIPKWTQRTTKKPSGPSPFSPWESLF